jgi:hypothetical protein
MGGRYPLRPAFYPKEAKAMKRLSVITILFILLVPGMAFATGTLALTSTADISTGFSKTLTIEGVADSAAGTWPALAINADTTGIAGKFLAEVEVDPGNTTAPNALTVKLYYTDDYTANTTNAVDLLGGAGTTLSATATTNFTTIFDATTGQRGYKFIRGGLTLVVTQAAVAVNSATVGIKLTFAR